MKHWHEMSVGEHRERGRGRKALFILAAAAAILALL